MSAFKHNVSSLCSNFLSQSPCCCCSVTTACLTLCDPTDCSRLGLFVPHYLLEFALQSPYPSIIFPYTTYQLLTSHTFICLFIFFFHLNANSVYSKDFSYKNFSYSQDNAAQIRTWPNPGSSNIFCKKVLMHVKKCNNFPRLHSYEFLLR